MHISSLLRRTLGLKGHKAGKVKEAGGTIAARFIPRKNAGPTCSGCGKRRPGPDTLPEGRWRHVPLWGIPVIITYRPRRVKRARCGPAVEQMG
jgi:transposase